MSAVFPILKRDGSAYANLTEFKQDLNKSTSGRYILSAGHGWHGGVHLNSQSFPWGKGLRSIQAMLGGKVAAYRINDDYVSSGYMNETFKFSNNFVLLEHEYADPTEGSNKVFTFYTLYMHLAPPSAIGVNAECHSHYKIESSNGVKARTFGSGNLPPQANDVHVLKLLQGVEFEYLDSDSKTVKRFTITVNNVSTDYAMIRCKVTTGTEQGKEVWIASGKWESEDKFEFLSDYIKPVPTPEPAWMAGSDIKRDGSVVVIKKPDGEDTRISIDAGSDLGYLSLNEFSQKSDATKKHEHVVHIEMFSIDKPEEYFLKQFGNINQTPVDGTASDGAVAPGNSLFEQLITLTGEEDDAPTTLMTTEALLRRLDSRRKKFENLIVQHKSEWYQESATQMIDAICDVAIGVMDNTCSRSFTNNDTYQSSDWRANQLTAIDAFSVHQKERAELLSWIQDASDIIPADPKPYYFWPFFGCDLGFKITKPQMAQMFPTENNTVKQRRELIRTIFNKYSGTFKVDNAEKAAQFFAQIKAEVGIELLGGEEDLTYSSYALTHLFTRYFDHYPDEADDLAYKNRINKNKYLTLSDEEKALYQKYGSHYYTQIPDKDGIAKRVYSCRLTEHGSGFVLIQGGDQSGIDYKGKGFIQLTWKNNYNNVQVKLEEILFDEWDFNIVENPDLLVTNTKAGFLSALGFWDINDLN